MKINNENKTILFLLHDHDPLLVKVIQNKLKKDAEWDSIISTNYDEAVEKFVSHKPDAVMTELTSINADGSGKTGFDLIVAIKNLDTVKKTVPIIVFSELNKLEDKQKALELGATLYFSKSEVTLLQVIEILKGILKDL